MGWKLARFEILLILHEGWEEGNLSHMPEVFDMQGGTLFATGIQETCKPSNEVLLDLPSR